MTGKARFYSLLMLLMTGFYVAAAEEEMPDAASRLNALFDMERTLYYRENPISALYAGRLDFVHGMPRVTPADKARQQTQGRQFLSQLDGIDRAALSAENQLNYDLFRYELNNRVTLAAYRGWRIPFYSDSGFHTAPVRMWQVMPFRTREDYERYLTLIADMPRYFEEQIANLRLGMDEGFTMPKIVLDGLLPTFDFSVDKAEDSVFYGPFKNFPENMADADVAALKAAAADVIMDKVVKAYADLHAFMRDSYYPAARDSLGASDFPAGDVYYSALVKYYTTTDITPDEVHQIGLREVARIRAEMEAVIARTGFKGSFADFIHFLRTDPQFYAKSEKELLMTASYIAKRIDGKMPSMFRKLPRQPYGVEPVPASIAPNYTTGRYVGAPLDSNRGGTYWVNSYALDKRPLYVLPSLTLHEGVPGHHHQTALAKELKEVPEFRRQMYPHAFGEGWGLYSEKLGIEMGIYETPYEDFGRLSYEMWRACRLVIDTGIHAKGWTRDQAIALMTENSALSLHNIRTEVDRYISWPGQALAYKMGELKILELRARAEKALGSAFDVRDFHDRVLAAGGIPLAVLEVRIDDWIKSRAGDN